MCFSLIGEVFEAKVMNMAGKDGKNEEKLCLEKIFQHDFFVALLPLFSVFIPYKIMFSEKIMSVCLFKKQRQ